MKTHDIETIIAILMVAVPIIFVWTAEITFYTLNFNPETVLTNGFMSFTLMQGYHVWMYAMFTTNIIGSFLLIRRKA